MKKKKLPLVATTTLLFMAAVQTAAAQGWDNGNGKSAYKSSWGLNTEVINFDTNAARQRELSGTGYGLGINYHGETRLLNFDAGASYFYIEDDDRRRKIDQAKRKYNNTSGTTGYALHIDGGPQLPINDSGSFIVGLNAGYRYFDIDRSIANCSDCSSDPIDIGSSTYIKPFVSLKFNERFDVRLTYYNYLKDKGLNNSLQLGFNWRL